MRKWKFLSLILIISVLVIGACGKKPADDTKNDPVLTTEKETEGGSIESGDGFGFTIFDLEIDINGEDAIDVSYDVTEQADADYKNKLNEIDVEGAKAMDELDILFKEIRLTKDTPEDQAINDILKFYEIDDYSKFELNVNFDEGTELRIHKTK
ncbi:YusW family protein [Sporosarcina ureilytica]|uniref:YusW-like protein n=1 Tax=Sporosarcina ureilytica TaxID=298596 RepID=A0A1D8JJP1_9BACL|nr:YusW family protein [Sporosarcina ureilytica]AOV08913.1 hypothetical protein BI350_16060 [Sporosarcina ureilytica]